MSMGKIIAVIVILSMLGAATWFVFEAGADSVRADMAETVRQAVKAAREAEQKKQEKVNDIAQEQHDEQTRINGRLTADLIELRDRPSRRHLPGGTGTACKGATGAELSRPDAEFLTRFAARADKAQTGLAACYKHIDDVIQP